MFSAFKTIQAGGNELQDRAEFFWLGSNLVLVVADGAGGMSGGAEAADFVVRGIRRTINSTNLNPQGICDLLTNIDQEMAGIGAYGETTCVVLVASDNNIIGASVGDSGAWVIREDALDNLTEYQHRKPFLGSGRAIPTGFSRGKLQGTLFVASDGLLKYTSPEKIAAAARIPNLEQAAQGLVNLVRYSSGALPDDVSILLARPS